MPSNAFAEVCKATVGVLLVCLLTFASLLQATTDGVATMSANCQGFVRGQLGYMSTAGAAGFTASCLSQLPPSACQSWSASALGAVQPVAMHGLGQFCVVSRVCG